MDPWIEEIKDLLERTPTGAAPLSSLLESMKEAGILPEGREDWVLQRMAELDALFKVVPDRFGPWMAWPEEASPASGDSPGRTQRGDPWIMTWDPPPPHRGPEGKLAGRVRESLQAWGRGLDDGSQASVARWIEVQREAGRTVTSCLTRPE